MPRGHGGPGAAGCGGCGGPAGTSAGARPRESQEESAPGGDGTDGSERRAQAVPARAEFSRDRLPPESRPWLPAAVFSPAIPLVLWVVPCTALCWWARPDLRGRDGYAAWGAPVWLWTALGALLGPLALLAMYLATTPTNARHGTTGRRTVVVPPGPVSAAGPDGRFAPGDAEPWLSRPGNRRLRPGVTARGARAVHPSRHARRPEEAGLVPRVRRRRRPGLPGTARPGGRGCGGTATPGSTPPTWTEQEPPGVGEDAPAGPSGMVMIQGSHGVVDVPSAADGAPE